MLVQQILQQEPENHPLQVMQVNLLLELSPIDEARQLIDGLPDDTQGITQLKAKLAFYEMVAEASSLAEFASRLAENTQDHESRYKLSIRLVITDKNEQALNNLLQIVRVDRMDSKDGARLLILKVFD